MKSAVRISARRNESFTAKPRDEEIMDGSGDGKTRRKAEGSFKTLMAKLKEIQPNTMKVSRRENDAIYHNFDYQEQKENKNNKKGGGYFIERQIRNLKAREDLKRQSIKKQQETEAEKAAKIQRQQYMERMKLERDKKFRMNE